MALSTPRPFGPHGDPPATSFWRALRADTAERTYRFGTRRAVSPAETLRRIRPLLGRAGITRLADVTGLDWVGLPVYQAIRPNSRNLSVSQGKGLTRDQAKVSALMEALELFHAEEIRQPAVRATVGAMRSELAYDPYQLPLGEPSYLRDETVLDWIQATNLATGAPTWLPRRLCELDFCLPERRHAPLFRVGSNGLAGGNTVGEAVLHGLCEVIERDGTARHLATQFEPERSVAPDSIAPRLARRLLDRLARAGFETHIADTSGPTGLPSFAVWLNHPDVPVLHGGSGCHPSRLTALLRALTEAVQSRLTSIAGSRDDIRRDRYRRPLLPPGAKRRPPFPAEAGRQFRRCPGLPMTGPGDQVDEIVRRVRRVTGMPPLAVDLTRPDFGIPVVFVVAPGLRYAHLEP
jgi:ribosomal protein S12 methylthiotransferase accessory factor